MLFAPFKKRRGILWLPVVLVVLFFILVGLLGISADEQARTTISDIFTPIFNLLATLTLAIAAQHSHRVSQRLAIGWGLLALAQLSFTLGDILWGVLELGLNTTSFPSIADVFYLAYYPLFLLGIYLFPGQKQSRSEWVKRILDVAIIMLAAVVFFWVFLIGPILSNDETPSFIEKFLSAAYPVGDLLLLLALMIILYYRSTRYNHGPALLLAIGSLLMIVTDTIFSTESLAGTYQSGGTLDLGWILAYGITAVAGIYQIVAVDAYQENKAAKETSDLYREKLERILGYMPYIWVAGAYILLMHFSTLVDPNIYSSLFISVGCIIGLVILRQIIALIENDRLLFTLVGTLKQVNHQASELNRSNQNLQQEIKKRQRIEERLTHEALHDGLTGLANRVLLIDRLAHALEINRRDPNFHCSILFLDIDNFKAINDGLGHLTGDQMLIEISNRIKSCTRSVDTVARFGGDEFVILLEDIQENNPATSVAMRILADVERPYFPKGRPENITCSIGVVQDIGEYKNSEDILRDVDIALYRAKEKGKDRFEVFNLEMRTSALARLEMAADLNRALANQEFFLEYQPIYHLDPLRIESIEALVRWRHPTRGVVMPNEFIHLAEETGNIASMGDWVLREACVQLLKWQEAFPQLDQLSVNVNISGKQINQKGFVDEVKDVISDTGMNPRRLILEITENAFVDNQPMIDDMLSALRDLGVAFAIDDFGTGYSSLGCLQNFSVNTIKIDKSFVDDVVVGKKSNEIVRTIILMSQGLGIYAIAEGIEKKEQLQKLLELNCQCGQGYYLSPPVNASTIENLLHEQIVVNA